MIDMTAFDKAWDFVKNSKKPYRFHCRGCGPQKWIYNPETEEHECESCGMGESSETAYSQFGHALEGNY